MPSRELTYRIVVATSDAKRQAKNVRTTFERELRQITMGKLDTTGLANAVKAAHALRLEFDAAAAAAQRASQNANSIKPPTVSGGGGVPGQSLNLPTNLAGGAAAALGLFGAGQIAGTIADMAKLGTESTRTGMAFDFLSGNATVAGRNIDAIKTASGGTITSLEAMGVGNQALALGLADTAVEFDRLVRASRAVALVSPIISDVGGAISELGLASANLSYRRLDQLGLSVQEVRTAMSELRRENEDMSESQAFLEASISTLLSKYGGIIDAEEARATALERMGVAISDLKTLTAEPISVIVNTITNPLAGFLENEAQAAQGRATFLDQTTRAYELAAGGIKGADEVQQSYINSIREAIALYEAWTIGPEEYKLRIDALVSGLDNYEASIKSVADAEQKRENDRMAGIFEQQPSINQALAARAQKAAPEVGIEQAIATYREQKAQVETLLQELADTGITDTNEIGIRVAAIVDSLLAPFDALEEKAATLDIGALTAQAYEMNTAVSGFDAAFVDALPGLSAMRDELLGLGDDLAFGAAMSAEQAAEFDYLGGAATVVADTSSGLSAVVNGLGIEFLLANENAASTVDQMYLAEIAFNNGQISADVYAGIISVLSGRLLNLATDAGIATGAIRALNDAQQGKYSVAGLNVGESVSARLDNQNAIRERETARREQERLARESARATTRAFNDAARATERAFEEAARQLESDLKSIPGLFGRSKVTAEQMSAADAGIAQNFADDFLRRAEDEFKNGVDWPEVDLTDIARRVGLDASLPAEQIFNELAAQWESGALFADKANLELINKEAVDKALALKEKAREGQANILEFFGAQVDSAVASITGSGGSASQAATAAAQAATGTTEGAQAATLGIVPSFDVEAIQAQLDALQLAVSLSVDITGIQAQLDKVTAPTLSITPHMAFGATEASEFTVYLEKTIPKPGIAPSLGVTVEEIALFKELVSTLVKPTVQVGLSLAATGEGETGEAPSAVSALIASVSTDIGANAATFVAQGASVAQIIIAGLIAHMKSTQQGAEGEASNTMADALAGKLNTEFGAMGGTFYALGMVPAQSVESGFNAYPYSNAADGLLTGLTKGIGEKAGDFVARGDIMGRLIQTGIENSFKTDIAFTFAMNAGAAWGAAFMRGAISAVGGGELVKALSEKVVEDIATELESTP